MLQLLAQLTQGLPVLMRPESVQAVLFKVLLVLAVGWVVVTWWTRRQR